MPKYTKEEEFELIVQNNEAEERGDTQEAERLQKLLPIAPSVAASAKRVFGVQFLQDLIHQGYDFSEVEEYYGKDWLAY